VLNSISNFFSGHRKEVAFTGACLAGVATGGALFGGAVATAVFGAVFGTTAYIADQLARRYIPKSNPPVGNNPFSASQAGAGGAPPVQRADSPSHSVSGSSVSQNGIQSRLNSILPQRMPGSGARSSASHSFGGVPRSVIHLARMGLVEGPFDHESDSAPALLPPSLAGASQAVANPQQEPSAMSSSVAPQAASPPLELAAPVVQAAQASGAPGASPASEAARVVSHAPLANSSASPIPRTNAAVASAALAPAPIASAAAASTVPAASAEAPASSRKAKRPQAPLDRNVEFVKMATNHAVNCFVQIRQLVRDASGEDQAKARELIDAVLDDHQQSIVDKGIDINATPSNVRDAFSALARFKGLILGSTPSDNKQEVVGLTPRDKLRQQVLRRDTSLTLADLGMTSVPAEIAAAYFTQELDLSKNELTTLPKSVAALPNLVVLRLSDNQLAELPEALMTLPGLQIYGQSNRFSQEYVGQFNEQAEQAAAFFSQGSGGPLMKPARLIVS
jgi:hypothetical protein